MFCTYVSNLVIVARTADADKQVIDTHTDTHTLTDTQTGAMTIPEGQNWPRVKHEKNMDVIPIYLQAFYTHNKLWLKVQCYHLADVNPLDGRAYFRFAPSQWETALLCNDVSCWLGARLQLLVLKISIVFLLVWYQRQAMNLNGNVPTHYQSNMMQSTTVTEKY